MSEIDRSKKIPKPTHFGKNLRFLRRMKGMSQSELADRTGMRRNNIASYESGLVEPHAVNFLNICSFLEVDPKHMLENVMSDHPADAVSVGSPQTIKGQLVLDQIEDFTTQTSEMTKVLEGYRAFVDMKRSSDTYEQHKELYSTLRDLLDLLETLVRSNWSLIHSVYAEKEEEE